MLKCLQAGPVTDVCMSVVTEAELLYSVEVSPRRNQDAAGLGAFLPYVEARASAVFWKMLKMTNSAGRTGAIPISQISRPFNMSSCDIVDHHDVTS